MTPPAICAVIPTHNPGAVLIETISRILPQVRDVVVVDNASGEAGQNALQSAAKLQKVRLIRNSSNLGQGAALNAGIRAAKASKAEWVLVLDQDSLPDRNMLSEMLAAISGFPEDAAIAIVAPHYVDHDGDNSGSYLRRRCLFWFERSPCNSKILDRVSVVIASGCLISVEALETAGLFREDYFIDYVDTEFCLRVQEFGYQILVACRAHLEHRIGAPTLAHVGPLRIRPRNQSPDRWYFMARNRIPTLCQYGLRFPHWAVFDLGLGFYHFLTMLVAEDHRFRKVLSFLQGTWDGVLGSLGPRNGMLK